MKTDFILHKCGNATAEEMLSVYKEDVSNLLRNRTIALATTELILKNVMAFLHEVMFVKLKNDTSIDSGRLPEILKDIYMASAECFYMPNHDKLKNLPPIDLSDNPFLQHIGALNQIANSQHDRWHQQDKERIESILLSGDNQ